MRVYNPSERNFSGRINTEIEFEYKGKDFTWERELGVARKGNNFLIVPAKSYESGL